MGEMGVIYPDNVGRYIRVQEMKNLAFCKKNILYGLISAICFKSTDCMFCLWKKTFERTNSILLKTIPNIDLFKSGLFYKKKLFVTILDANLKTIKER